MDSLKLIPNVVFADATTPDIVMETEPEYVEVVATAVL